MTISELRVKLGIVGALQVQDAIRDTTQRVHDLSGALLAMAGALAAAGGTQGFDAFVKFDSAIRGLATNASGVADLTNQLARLKAIAAGPGLGVLEAISGSTKLQAAGLSAGLAERALRAFGNAIASVGGNKDVLEGVVTALSQIQSKGKLFAEEVNQIAERVPQIRVLLAQAFGTADTEQIQKMGLTAVDAIQRIVSAAEKLPQASGGIQNLIDNLGDLRDSALRVLGQGVAEAFTAAAPTIERVIGLIETRFRQLAEVLSALGRSGVLSEVIERLAIAIDSLFGRNPQDTIIRLIANLASLIVNLPDLISNVAQQISSVFESLLINSKNIFNFLIDYVKYVRDVIGAFATDIRELLKDIANPLRLLRGGGIGGFGSNLDKKLAETGPPSAPLFPPLLGLQFLLRNPFRDANRFADQINAFLRPLNALPGDLSFGGGSAAQGAQKNTTLLEKIENNTREAVSLQRAIRGGGELGRLGVTAAELGTGSGLQAAFNRQARKVAAQQFAIATGGGFRPR